MILAKNADHMILFVKGVQVIFLIVTHTLQEKATSLPNLLKILIIVPLTDRQSNHFTPCCTCVCMG